jgi:hypothetical protein
LFTPTQVWSNHERIQADVVDHILAIAGVFDLRGCQNPAGLDGRTLLVAFGARRK